MAAVSGSSDERRLKTTASTPPGRSTRWISGNARDPSNQWNAWAAVRASAAPSAKGIDSAVPSTTSMPGTRPTSSSRMPATGSTAMTVAPVRTSRRVSLPVPAARSTTVRPARRSSCSARKPTAAAGYEGRPRSYASAAGPKARARWSTRSVTGSRLGPDVLAVGSPAGRGEVGLPHHQLATEVTDLLAPLVEPLRLDGDDAAVVLGRRLALVEHPGLGVDGVAVEGRLLVRQRLDLEVGDARSADIGDAHAQHQRVDEVADDHVLLVHGLVLGKPLVGVQRVVVHRDHAEERVVVLGDRLARPALVDVADLEVLVVAPERPVQGGHGGESYRWGAVGRKF